MTTAIVAHDPVEKYAAQGDDDLSSAVARLNSNAYSDLVEFKPRWRLTEEEIVRAAITVILVALVVVICVAGGAIVTMG
ncbi:hypothetical protein AWB92_08775 [Mycobacterium sp. IEC1808]|uniref:hypothetical protein n=1 Tax=Mycobacterium sp. IEC1808 TaxID=1743230 RepID=UPI000A15C175|nr:hypothetical protein [Mycobacterium sp. IEC1808]ORW95746.1 hypothetical protein AWB92_08775 [Mycobacterium sp. IEC1808]